jgi:hypothetical protein
VFALDALSLTLCHGWDGRDLPEIDGVAIRVEPAGEGEATLDPWPLGVDGLEVSVAVRTLDERFDDEVAMQAALAAAPNERQAWRLRPAG